MTVVAILWLQRRRVHLPLRAAPLGFRVRQGADLIAVHHHPGAIGKLLDLVPINGDCLFAETEQAAHLQLNGLELAVRPSLNLDDLSKIFAVRAESLQTFQTSKTLVSLGLGTLPGSSLFLPSLRLSLLALSLQSCSERLSPLLHGGNNGLA